MSGGDVIIGLVYSAIVAGADTDDAYPRLSTHSLCSLVAQGENETKIL